MARATIIDERQEEETQQQVDNLDTEDTTEEVSEGVEQTPQEQPVVPDKYQGKSVQDLVQMHQEAEKALGRQSGEVGELRKVVDDYIQTQLSETAPSAAQAEPDDDYDFFVEPEKAIARAVDNHPKIKEAEQYTLAAKKQAALSTLQQKHPDMQKIVQDPKFAEWIQASKIRTQLFVAADQNFDYDSADELFSLWKERQGVAQQTAVVEKQARKQAVKAAKTGTARGSSEGSRKKVYRRSDIINLMQNDPDRYASLSEEIFKAYQEGRVK